jgi:hypothetical protein
MSCAVIVVTEAVPRDGEKFLRRSDRRTLHASLCTDHRRMVSIPRGISKLRGKTDCGVDA